jgi:formamidopyrimidine-DNA glycosylase
MPELPEVETVVRSLRPLLVGRTIVGVEMPSSAAGNHSRKTNGTILRRLLATPAAEFERQLCGARIENIERCGKHIVMPLSSPGAAARALVVHLGMTGHLAWHSTPEPQERHTHFIFALDSPGRWLHYSDPRRFGKLRIAGKDVAGVAGLGPDPLEITEDEFFSLLRARRSMLKSLLLDQRFLRGLGNIYADESLFRAALHPKAIAAGLNNSQARALYRAIRETLQEAIASGGSSISSYADAEGRRGWFQQAHQVYGRECDRCVRCGKRHGTKIRRIVIASRSTHFCPRCQRAPRRKSRRAAR